MLITNRFDLPQYVDKFLRYLKRQHFSKDTLYAYERDLRKFSDYIFQEYSANILTEEIHREDLDDFLAYLEDEGLKPNTILRHLSTLKSFYNFLVYEMDFNVNVAAQIRHKTIHNPLPDPLTFDELEAFFKAAKKYSNFYHTFFSLIYYTGSRITPIQTLLKENVDLTQQKIYFPNIKNDMDLLLPLHDAVVPILADYMIETRTNGSIYVFPSPKLKNRPISKSCIRMNIKKIARLAGINKRVYPHLLRHTTAAHLTVLDINQKAIADILGHRDLRSTERYQKLNIEDLRPKLNRLEHF